MLLCRSITNGYLSSLSTVINMLERARPIITGDYSHKLKHGLLQCNRRGIYGVQTHLTLCKRMDVSPCRHDCRFPGPCSTSTRTRTSRAWSLLRSMLWRAPRNGAVRSKFQVRMLFLSASKWSTKKHIKNHDISSVACFVWFSLIPLVAIKLTLKQPGQRSFFLCRRQ